MLIAKVLNYFRALDFRVFESIEMFVIITQLISFFNAYFKEITRFQVFMKLEVKI